MVLLACLALGIAACHDPALAPRSLARDAPSAITSRRPVRLASYTCVLDGRAASVRCDGPAPSSNLHARFHAYDMVSTVKDTVAHTWTFSAVVQNLLSQPIGTLDGTTTVGTKVAITAGPKVIGGTGMVMVANADGADTFTGPNQPYFFYDEITAPQASTAQERWRFHVPNTVSEISISVVVLTDFPAERDVTERPPDGVDPSIYDDTNLVRGTSTHMPGATFPRNVIDVLFEQGTSRADRQLAVAGIGATDVGGAPMFDDGGIYVVRLPGRTPDDTLFARIAQLRALPHVAMAEAHLVFSPAP